jgi:hypothetical protein
LANNLQTSTYEKLDRVLVSTEWKLKYPKVTVHALMREISDHTLLLLDTRHPSNSSKPNLFKFELSWLLKDGFYETVVEIWHKEKNGSTNIERWQNKIRHLKKYNQKYQKRKTRAYKQD